MIEVFTLVKRYWQLVVIAALLAWISLLKIEVADGKSDLAIEQADRAGENSARMKLALTYELKLGEKERKHAADQQTSASKFAEEKSLLQGRIADRDVRIGRMSRDLAAFTSGSRQDGDTDAIALGRCEDRLKKLGALVDRGQSLVERSVTLVEGRDLEVGRLKEQIDLDRAACSAP